MPGSATAALITDEIVTGERLQGLADSTLLPRAAERRHRGVARYARGTLSFAQHRDIDAEQLDRLCASRSIFVYSDALELFQQHVWPRLAGTGYVLITHNSDHEIGAEQLPWIDAQADKLGHWFAQNLLVDHPRLSPLPIGIANHAWEHGDLEALGAAIASARRSPRAQLLHARFALGTHPDRERAWSAVSRAFPELAAEPPHKLAYSAYLAELADHRFCVCPRGNGIDTHRFWECQYLGVTPIVERSGHTEHWARAGLPMIQLDDWSELSRERLRLHRHAEARALTTPPLPAPLRLSHHAARIAAASARSAPRASSPAPR